MIVRINEIIKASILLGWFLNGSVIYTTSPELKNKKQQIFSSGTTWAAIQTYLPFYAYKVGKNSLANRLTILSNKIPLNWLNMSMDTYKVHCKRIFLLVWEMVVKMYSNLTKTSQLGLSALFYSYSLLHQYFCL